MRIYFAQAVPTYDNSGTDLDYLMGSSTDFVLGLQLRAMFDSDS